MTSSLQLAVSCLQSGGVIAYPTEAVWGLGCDPWNEEATLRLLALKDRPVAKGLILVAGDAAQFAWLLEPLADDLRRQLDDTWPGPNTWLVPHRGEVPNWICGDYDTVALRVSAHPDVRGLCEAWGGPLVSTSANPGGEPPAITAEQCRKYFNDDIDYICPGQVGGAGRPTTIRDLVSGEVIRAA